MTRVARVARVARLALLATIAGCSAPPAETHYVTVEPWVGASIDDVILKRGPPDSAFKLANGDRVLEYRRVRATVIESRPYGAPIPGVPRRYAPPTIETYHCNTRFVVSPEGRIKSYKVEGTDCSVQ